MNTELVAEHTIGCLPLCFGHVLDVGCRRFDFSKAMLNEDYNVVAIEADDEVVPIHHEHLRFGNYALVPEFQNGETQTLIKFGNGTANHLSTIGVSNSKTTNNVTGMSITAISSKFNVAKWDVVKLDCEGSEYDVLLEWPGPIARQITVEFHEHTAANARGNVVYDDILKHLSQWYDLVQHEMSVRYCIPTPSYYDSLWVLK